MYWARVFGKAPNEPTVEKAADKYADEEAAYFATFSARNAGNARLPAESAPAQYPFDFETQRGREMYGAKLFGVSLDEPTGGRIMPAEGVSAQYPPSFETQRGREMYGAKLFGAPLREPTGEKIADHCAGDGTDYPVTLPARDAGFTRPSTDCPPPATPTRNEQVLRRNVQ